MYESFYGFKEKPFSLMPDPEFLYLSKEHGTVLALLEYGITLPGGIMVFTGEVGSGKTTLIRRLLEIMGDQFTVGMITNPHSDFGDLLKWMLMAFGLDHKNKDKVELYKTITNFITEQHTENHGAILIIDEAQNMNLNALEELRMISNINVGKDQVLQLLLVGQPELLEKLQRPDMRQFVQRISVNYHLKPMSFDDTCKYIQHRLKVAGGDPGIFDERACTAVHRHAGGVPRLINTICETALVYGFAMDQKHIGAETVNVVVEHKKRGGLNPFAT